MLACDGVSPNCSIANSLKTVFIFFYAQGCKVVPAKSIYVFKQRIILVQPLLKTCSTNYFAAKLKTRKHS